MPGKYAIIYSNAGMVELADTLDLGSSGSAVQVQVLLPAPAPHEIFDFVGSPFIEILGRNEFALRELGCAEIHGGLPPAARRRRIYCIYSVVKTQLRLSPKAMVKALGLFYTPHPQFFDNSNSLLFAACQSFLRWMFHLGDFITEDNIIFGYDKTRKYKGGQQYVCNQCHQEQFPERSYEF